MQMDTPGQGFGAASPYNLSGQRDDGRDMTLHEPVARVLSQLHPSYSIPYCHGEIPLAGVRYHVAPASRYPHIRSKPWTPCRPLIFVRRSG